ncbi:imelysin family protein [Enterobacter hormaechei]
MTAYKAYVTKETATGGGHQSLYRRGESGDIEKAKSLYAPTRQHYERIEPIAELFDLDGSIDAREDDYEQKAADPKFTGFHRLKSPCLATFPPGVENMPSSSTATCWSCKNASASWHSHRRKWWVAQRV